MRNEPDHVTVAPVTCRLGVYTVVSGTKKIAKWTKCYRDVFMSNRLKINYETCFAVS